MLPIIEVPETIRNGMMNYRNVFCRDEGFEHISRYVTGLVISPNKTLQGIYDLQVWDGKKPGRRAMHGSVFETGWNSGILTFLIFDFRFPIAVLAYFLIIENPESKI